MADFAGPEFGGLTVEVLSGPQIASAIPALSRLRVHVFREFPYLYAGDEAYETHYLQTYLDAPDSLVVLVRTQAGEVVGASSALPLSAELPELRAPFEAAGLPAIEFWYLAESVLLPDYRGRGLGVRFFAERERRGRELGYRTATFCAVDRPAQHPRRPAGYVPLDEFWKARGYQRRGDLRAFLGWQDLDEAHESPKPMTFWLKELT
ncbi:GNAT family N-acetyltransferase [Deinococcus sp. KNUC1210]|uniref:GNAT family N-acetyltransferase n=1 Tax=Deinococcus sp. KNUC1210 TaxID=2917691 RepID=UPI001EEFC329|nr:GNAT family N-acetyltransferase [Deinococcus sp. KNUC1210]ULH14336.1 GNAT family N-acetyltransferase [Deinococcus sp. KNUC1210]